MSLKKSENHEKNTLIDRKKSFSCSKTVEWSIEKPIAQHMQNKFVYFAVNCRTTSEITDFDTLFSMIKIFTSLSVYTHVVLQCSLLLLSSVVKVAPIFPWLEKKTKRVFI